MWTPILLLATIVGCLGSHSRHGGHGGHAAHQKHPESTKRHIGGGQRVPADKAPYHASLEFGVELACGATIISEYWALTSGSYIVPQAPRSFHVRTGIDRAETGGELHQVVEIIRHEGYKYIKLAINNVAVVKVETPFNSKHIIALGKARPAPGTVGTVTEWIGNMDDNFFLTQAQETILSKEDCNQAYKSTKIDSSVQDYMICARATASGGDASVEIDCHGLSGGSLVVDKILVGVVTGGSGCPEVGPEIYMDVAYFRDWIGKKTGLANL